MRYHYSFTHFGFRRDRISSKLIGCFSFSSVALASIRWLSWRSRWLGILCISNELAIESGKLLKKQTLLSSPTSRTHHCRNAKNSGLTFGKRRVNRQTMSWDGRITSYPRRWKHPFMHDFERNNTFFNRAVLTRMKPRPNSTPQTIPRSASFEFPRAINRWTREICLTNSVSPECMRVFWTSLEIELTRDWYSARSSSGNNRTTSELNAVFRRHTSWTCCGRAIPAYGIARRDNIPTVRKSDTDFNETLTKSSFSE